MSDKKVFEVSYIEYVKTVLYYRPIQIDIANYPELEGKTDSEISQYIRENASKMKAEDDFYDSLEEQIMDQDQIKEKSIPLETDVIAELYDEEDEEDDYDDDED